MHRLYTLVIIAAILFAPSLIPLCQAQQSEVRGVISVHNSLKETGTRKYISNAQVSDDFDKTQPVVSNQDGKFSLIYVGLANSQSVSFNVLRPGYEVVNISELTAVTGQADVVKISMAPPGRIAQYRAEIYKVGKSEAEKYLNRMLALKKGELSKINTELAGYKTSVRLLEQEIADLDEKLRRVKEQAEYLAKRYAIVNLDDASPFYREAFRHFENGRFDSALMILNRIDYHSAIDQLIEEKGNIDALQQEVFSRDSIYKERYSTTVDALKFKMDLHRTRLEYDSVNQCFEYLLKIDSTNTSLMYEYALFNSKLRNDSLALAWYDKLLLTTKNDSLIAVVKTEEGTIYQGRRQFGKAEQLFNESQILQKKLYSLDSVRYGASFVRTQVSLGNFYISTNKLADAQATMKQALSIQLNISNDYHLNEIQSNLSSIYGGLGSLSISMNNFGEAEPSLLKSIELLRKKNDAKVNERDAALAGRLCLLSNLYQSKSLFEKADTVMKEAEGIGGRLYTADRKMFEPLYADVMLQAARFDLIRGKDSSGISKLRLALATDEVLAKAAPQLYELNAMIAKGTLATYYYSHGMYDSACLIFAATDSIIRKYMVKSADAYQPVLAYNFISWANAEMGRKSYDAALRLSGSGAALFEALYKLQPEPYKTGFANACYMKASIYQNTNRADSAIAYYRSAEGIYKSIPEPFTQVIENTANVQFNQGAIYESIRELDKAAQSFLAAKVSQEALVQIDASKYEPVMVMIMFHLGTIDFNRNDLHKSIKDFTEAITMQRKLASTNKMAEPMLVTLLFESVRPHMTLNDLKTSEERLNEAVSLQRELVKKDDSYRPYLVTLLSGQIDYYKAAGRNDMVAAVSQEAILIQRLLVKKDSTFRPFLVSLLFNFANTCYASGKTDSAFLMLNEALGIQRSLTKLSAAYKPYYVTLLECKAHFLSNTGKTKEAISLIQTAMDQLVPQADTNRIHTSQLLKLRSSLAWFYNVENRLPESVALGREVIKRQEALVALSPDTELANLETYYLAAGMTFMRALQPDSALDLFFKASVIRRRMAEKYAYAKSGLVNVYYQISTAYGAKSDLIAARRFLDSAILVQEGLPVTPEQQKYLEQLYGQYIGIAYYSNTPLRDNPYREKVRDLREKLAGADRSLYEIMLSKNEYEAGMSEEYMRSLPEAARHFRNAIAYLESKHAASFSDSIAIFNIYNALIRVVRFQNDLVALDTVLNRAIALTVAGTRRDSLQFLPSLASFYYELGYIHLKDLPDVTAKRATMKALDIQERLYRRDSNAYRPFLVMILQQLSAIHRNTNSPDTALTFILRAISLQEELVAINEQYRPFLIRLHLDAAACYIAKKDYAMAKPILEAVLKFEQLFHQQGSVLQPAYFIQAQQDYANALRQLGN